MYMEMFYHFNLKWCNKYIFLKYKHFNAFELIAYAIIKAEAIII